jgi:HSP20 family protein
MDQLFDSFFGLTRREGEGATSVSVWAPSVDVREDAGSFYVTADLPGIDRDSVDIELENNTLTIKGERRFEKKDEKENYHYIERSYGSFFRSFSLPRNVNSEQINAEFKDGVLTITIPKAEAAKPRKVQIGSGSESGKKQMQAGQS